MKAYGTVWAWRTAGLVFSACAVAVTAPGARQSVVPQAKGPTVIWQVEGEGHGRPAHDSITAYFLSTRHEVVALDARTGRQRWRKTTLEPGDTTQGSALAVAGSVVVAADYNLVAFDRATGTLRWRFVPVTGYAPGIYLGESAAGLVLAGSPSGRVYAVSEDTGELIWSSVVASDGRTTVFQPVSDGVAVVAGYTTFVAPNTGGVVSLQAATGREMWRRSFPSAADHLLGTGFAGGPIVTSDAVIASSGDGTIYAFDRANGSTLWTLPPLSTPPAVFQGPFPPPAAPAAADFRPLARSGRTLVAGSLRGDVVAFDLVTRTRRWSYSDDSNGSVAFALASDADAVFVPYASGRQVALALSTGAVRWRTSDANGGFNWPAAPTEARVLLAGGKGGFVAVRR